MFIIFFLLTVRTKSNFCFEYDVCCYRQRNGDLCVSWLVLLWSEIEIEMKKS